MSDNALKKAHATFRRWFGEEFDMDTLNAVLAAAAVERLDGDPVWLMLISGSGNAKTETVQALKGMGAYVTSTINSEGALLSGTARKEVEEGATGGLLRELGERGVLVIKDFTSILESNRNTRPQVIAALREIYDGRWQRNLGIDGGRSPTWEGRIALIAACTTAWDRAHSVIGAMGDRFVVIRSDSRNGRLSAGRQAMANVGHEKEMREELAAAAGAVIASMEAGAEAPELPTGHTDHLLEIANLVTLARTPVERDYKGYVVDAYAAESPTRFAKQLVQVVRGGLAIGMTMDDAMRLAVRIARDSIPPLRFAIMVELVNDLVNAPQIAAEIQKPVTTVRREFQALLMLGLVHETRYSSSVDTYHLSDEVDPAILLEMSNGSAGI